MEDYKHQVEQYTEEYDENYVSDEEEVINVTDTFKGLQRLGDIPDTYGFWTPEPNYEPVNIEEE